MRQTKHGFSHSLETYMCHNGDAEQSPAKPYFWFSNGHLLSVALLDAEAHNVTTKSKSNIVRHILVGWKTNLATGLLLVAGRRSHCLQHVLHIARLSMGGTKSSIVCKQARYNRNRSYAS